MRHVRAVVGGRVQGVGFRDFTQREARARHLSGWVRNRRDGSVEVALAGVDAAVEDMLGALRQGPPSARIGSVEVTEATEDVPTGFHVRDTAWLLSQKRRRSVTGASRSRPTPRCRDTDVDSDSPGQGRLAMPARASHRLAAPPRDPNRAQPGEIIALAGWTTDRRRMALRRDPVSGRLIITTIDWSAEPFQQDNTPPVRH